MILFNFQEFCLTTSRKPWYLVRYFKFLNPYKCNPACVSSGRTCEYELQRENSPLFFLMDLLPVSINLSITLSVDQLSFFSRWKNKRESHRHAHSSTRLDMNIIDVLYYLTWDIKCLRTLFWGYGDLSKFGILINTNFCPLPKHLKIPKFTKSSRMIHCRSCIPIQCSFNTYPPSLMCFYQLQCLSLALLLIKEWAGRDEPAGRRVRALTMGCWKSWVEVEQKM